MLVSFIHCVLFTGNYFSKRQQSQSLPIANNISNFWRESNTRVNV